MEKHADLEGVLKALYRWRKAIMVTTIAAAILSVAISLLLPEYYKSTTTFYAASPDLNKPDRLFGDIDASYNYYGSDADIDRIRTIAESNDLVEFMVDSFDLYTVYDIDFKSPKAKHYVELNFLSNYKALRTEYDALQITIEDKDPRLAAAMANAARNKINTRAKSLIKDSQTKQLAIYNASFADQAKSIKQIEQEIAEVRSQYGKINANSYDEGSTKYESLQTRLEQLGVDQARLQDKINKLNSAYNTDVPAIHIIEEAKIPVVKSRPIKSLLVITATLAAFLFSVLGALLLDYYKGLNWQAIKA